MYYLFSSCARNVPCRVPTNLRLIENFLSLVLFFLRDITSCDLIRSEGGHDNISLFPLLSLSRLLFRPLWNKRFSKPGFSVGLEPSSEHKSQGDTSRSGWFYDHGVQESSVKTSNKSEAHRKHWKMEDAPNGKHEEIGKEDYSTTISQEQLTKKEPKFVLVSIEVYAIFL